jgi:hypothetical protein
MKIACLSTAILSSASLALAAAEEYYIAQDISTKQCIIVESPPATTELVLLENGQVFFDRSEAERVLTSLSFCTSKTVPARANPEARKAERSEKIFKRKLEPVLANQASARQRNQKTQVRKAHLPHCSCCSAKPARSGLVPQRRGQYGPPAKCAELFRRTIGSLNAGSAGFQLRRRVKKLETNLPCLCTNFPAEVSENSLLRCVGNSRINPCSAQCFRTERSQFSGK